MSSPAPPESPRPSDTQADLEAWARACEERRATGIMFHPQSIELVAEAFRALGRERAARR